MKSIHKAENLSRGLQERLNRRGIASTKSYSAAGYPKLSIGSVASIEIAGIDAVSKDVLGGQLNAYAPHVANFAFVSGNATPANNLANIDIIKAMVEISKAGLSSNIKESAVDLATAEALAGIDIEAEIDWPTKGM